MQSAWATASASLPDDYDNTACRAALARRGRAHVAQTDDGDGSAGNRAGEQRVPARGPLVGDHLRQAAVEHQQRHGGELGRLPDVHAAVVGEGDGRRQPVERQQRLDARADDVDPAQFRQVARQVPLGELRVVDDVVRRHEADRTAQHIQVLEVVAQGQLHPARRPRAPGRGVDALARELEDRPARAPGLEMQLHHRAGSSFSPDIRRCGRDRAASPAPQHRDYARRRPGSRRATA